MPRRQIKDERGCVWDVWDVSPKDAVGRAAYDRRNATRVDDAVDESTDAAIDAVSPEGPQDATTSPSDAAADAPMLSAELENGWLCYQSGSDRRRFAPIPPNWADLPDGVLRVMLDVASVVMTPANGSPQNTAPDAASPAAE